MNKLSSQDRASLIKLASSLPAGSPEKRAILAGLDLPTTKEAGIGPSGLLKIEITGDGGGPGGSWSIWKGTLDARKVPRLDTALSEMFEFSENQPLEKLANIEAQIKALQSEKEDIMTSPEFKKGLAVAKAWGLPLDKSYYNANISAEDSSGKEWMYSEHEGWQEL